MSIEDELVQLIDLDKIYLDKENPRHEPLKNESEIINYLCQSEQVYPLAKDIVKHGLNPLEVFAVIDDSDETNEAYIIAEGNRRLCALKLLNDPERAPTKWKKDFNELSNKWNGTNHATCIIFEDKNNVKIWLDRIHAGQQGGIGRVSWNAEQKQRFNGSNKNKAAQELLDYAERKEFITPEQRKKKLTTVQRYLSNSVFSESLGLDKSNPEDLCRTRPEDDFNHLVHRFMKDIIKNVANSRQNKPSIDRYSRQIISTEGISNKRIEPHSISNDQDTPDIELPSPSKPNKKPTFNTINTNKDIIEKLNITNNYKLQTLYYSICKLRLKDHTPLISVGSWAFIETLSSLIGKNENTSFPNYFNKLKLGNYNIKGNNAKAILSSLKRISSYGNTTKHHHTAANFNGDQLANDMHTLEPLILACINEFLT